MSLARPYAISSRLGAPFTRANTPAKSWLEERITEVIDSALQTRIGTAEQMEKASSVFSATPEIDWLAYYGMRRTHADAVIAGIAHRYRLAPSEVIAMAQTSWWNRQRIGANPIRITNGSLWHPVPHNYR